MTDINTLALETLLTLCLLLFGAKTGGEICKRMGIAEVIGELLGGIVLLGHHPVVLNDAVMAFAEVGAVTMLFLVGLETSFAEFRRSGLVATVVAIGGVIVPFILGYEAVVLFGYPIKEALLVGAALTATSIAITVKTLQDIGRSKTSESGILVSAAVIDDVLGLIVLMVLVTTIVTPVVLSRAYAMLERKGQKTEAAAK